MRVVPLDSLWSRMAWKYVSGKVGPVKRKRQFAGQPGLGLRHVCSVEWLYVAETNPEYQKKKVRKGFFVGDPSLAVMLA